MSECEVSLDTDLIFERRLSLGLSVIELASRLGTSSVAIRSLESGRNHERLTLHFLRRLAEVLALSPVMLFGKAHEELEPAEREVKAEAALALVGRKISPQDLGLALGWSLEETHAVCRMLRDRRASTGVRVHYTGGQYGLAPARDQLSPTEIRALERACVRRRRLGIPEAGVLKRIFAAGTAGVSPGDLSEGHKPLAGWFLRLGWIEERRGRLFISGEVIENLRPTPSGETPRLPTQPP